MFAEQTQPFFLGYVIHQALTFVGGVDWEQTQLSTQITIHVRQRWPCGIIALEFNSGIVTALVDCVNY
ncbi:hypothetical protein D3C86_1685010 [compost metagenome]